MSQSNSELPSRFGEFEIGRVLGRGGMGVVYEAVQTSLGRRVALKVLGGGLSLTPQAVDRFRREAAAAARLHHTNIVPIYATGSEADIHYYVMELIDGPSLDCVLRKLRESEAGAAIPEAPGETIAYGGFGPTIGSNALSHSSFTSGSHYYDNVARLIAGVADALEHAHYHGVLHRDVKPANLLLSSDGRLSLNDFGLARVLEEPSMTATGEFLGTPAYMSPEQITGGRVPIDHRTDVYSLGATLYELLTYCPPFVGSTRDQVLSQILYKEPAPPRRLNSRVPVDLETICLKALDKDPDRRYQTAGALAEDLRRYINRFAISARRASLLDRGMKWVKRRPAVAAASLLALVAVVFAAVFGRQMILAERARIADREQYEQQARDDRKQAALDRALLVAMSGNLSEAEDAILEAEQLGVSAGQVYMLRGQVSLHAGRTRESISLLKRAVQLLPESVAAWSMLAKAHDSVGEWVEFNRAMAQIHRLTPITAEDYLFKAFAETGFDGSQALETLKDALRLRPSSNVGRLIRADVRAHAAIDQSNQQLAEQAVLDAESAKQDLPGNPVAIWTSGMANVAAAYTYQRLGLSDRLKDALARADGDAAALKNFTQLPEAVITRWQILRILGREDESIPELHRASEQTDHLGVSYAYAVNLYRRGKPADLEAAAESLEKWRGTLLGSLLRCFVLAETNNGPARAYDAYRELVALDLDGWNRIRSQSVLRYLGRKSEAVAVSQRYKQEAFALSPLRITMQQRILDYSALEISEELFLKGMTSMALDRTMTHHFVALTRLADGDRAGARDHLQKCVDARVFSTTLYDLSRVMLDRLEKNPSWPPWVP
jgi:serine/threonine protein kinase